LNDRQQRYVDNVLKSGRHLLELVNDVLDLSKVEAGHMELHPERLDLRDLLAEAGEKILPLAQKNGIALHIQTAGATPGPVLRADRVRCIQILYNLLSNA